MCIKAAYIKSFFFTIFLKKTSYKLLSTALKILKKNGFVKFQSGFSNRQKQKDLRR